MKKGRKTEWLKTLFAVVTLLIFPFCLYFLIIGFFGLWSGWMPKSEALMSIILGLSGMYVCVKVINR